MRPLNLASRPFRNESLPNLLFLAGALALIALTAAQALMLRRLLSGGSSALQADVASLEAELHALRREGQALRGPAPDSDEVTEWRVIEDLVDRRTFSWSRLLAQLEGVLPPGVRLVSIDPQTSRGRVRLDVVAVARSREDAFEFVRVLSERGGFEGVRPLSLTRDAEGEQISCTMTYRPGAPKPEPSPPPAGESP